MEWLSANMGTIVVSLILIAIVIWDIKKIISDRKKGIKSCGMNCPGCTGSCHEMEIPERFNQYINSPGHSYCDRGTGT